jgi:cycloartenol synthase
MWRLKSAEEGTEVKPTIGEPLATLCTPRLAGRQVWDFEEDGATSAKTKSAVEKARQEYASNRKKGVKHSADELLRIQCCGPDYKDVVRVQPTKSSSSSQEEQEEEVDKVKLDESLLGGLEFYQQLQLDDGHWPGDYGGPMFLMPGLIITCYVTGSMDSVLPAQSHRAEMIRYLKNHQNDDGGYGLHIEGHSTMFGTVLSYVSLRLLGAGAEDHHCSKARKWILIHGGATLIPSWGKFWLAVLGCFEWSGLNPVPPEVWLLPYSGYSGIGYMHPGRFWCHCRMVYLPMSYIYGARITGERTPLVEKLREELFLKPYKSIDWKKARNECAKEDLYYPHPLVQDALWWGLYKFENFLLPGRPLSFLRRKALAETLKHITYEDENTRYVCIGPVNKVMNMLCRWHADPGGKAFKMHASRVPDYLWVAEDGMKMQGYNGSQLWDTTFAVQAVFATGMASKVDQCVRKAASYIEATQVLDDCPGNLVEYYRHISKGAWPFSTRDHGWPISDCSSEGLKASLMLESYLGGKGKFISDDRLDDCVNVILSYQNKTGGWATYENTRSFPQLELINPAETFGDIVIDYDYVECSSACITAIAAFIARNKREWTSRFTKSELKKVLSDGHAFVKSIQREDGSWYGSWGVCFTYAAWFGCEALVECDKILGTCSESSLARACDFLIERQRPDGGWGESYLSCELKKYSQLPDDSPSHAVNTAWAMLALIKAGQQGRDPRPLHRGASFLMGLQMPCGDWPQQHISGVFNRNCMITYANYRNIFPLWALGEYKQHVVVMK